MSRTKKIAVITAATLALAISASPALAGHGGRAAAASASCSVSGGLVSATGLPIGVLLNFLYSSAGSSGGWVLGYTSDGTWTVRVPARSGPTTYQFISTTWGPNGSKYDVYATCSA